ncbi:hypothetical protein OIU74_023380 [Salix koriyanagi]|uniref:Uncharacterized protein n=1 Tax=Salix koriyanagi TaxID=2511006 RepID=A0A9Q0WCL4_9ROSI|nr:hypothetical protein OIU74_023380 [Salix koriyanagi]
MNLASSPKESNPTMAAFPRSISSMAASIGGLAVFLVIASLLSGNQSSIDRGHDNDVDVVDKDSSSGSDLKVLISLGGVNNNSVNASDGQSGSDLQESTTGASFKENDVDKGSEESSSDAASTDSKSGPKSDVSAVPSNASKAGSDDSEFLATNPGKECGIDKEGEEQFQLCSHDPINTAKYSARLF